MKKSSAVTLTLVTSVALAACAPDPPPSQDIAGYRDPNDTTRVSSTPRPGYVPFFFPIYVGGGFYDSRGVYRRSGSSAGGGTYRTGTTRGTTARGGFGTTGTSRSTYS